MHLRQRLRSRPLAALFFVSISSREIYICDNWEAPDLTPNDARAISSFSPSSPWEWLSVPVPKTDQRASSDIESLMVGISGVVNACDSLSPIAYTFVPDVRL